MKYWIIAAVAAAPLCTAAAAQAPVPPPVVRVIAPPAAAPAPDDPDSEAFAAALALFEGKDMRQQLLASVGNMMGTALETRLSAYREQGKEIPPSLLQKLHVLLAREAEAMVDAVEPTFVSETAAVYARHFTAEELHELKRLQDNPVMQKAERIMPQLFAELSKIGLRAAEERRPEFEKNIADMLGAWLQEQKLDVEPPKT